MADLCERADVLDPAGREVHVPGADGRGGLVHSTLEELERHADTVRAAHELDACAAIGDREERVTIGREVEIGDEDLRSLGVVECARDADEPGRDVRLDRDLVDRCPEHAGELLAERLVFADPVVVPRAPALLGPFGQEPLDARATAPVQRRERAVVQIVEALGDRELRTPGLLGLFHHQPAT